MSSSNIVDSITQKVSENFTDQVGFLQKLVQTSSINPYTSENKRVDDPIEKDVAELIFSQLKNHKLEPKKIGASKQRFNVVASLGPQRHRRSLLFNGHMDTAFISGLTRKNFLGTVKKNKLYGLGSLDMKGSLSAYIYATKAITDLDYKLKGRLTLAFVADQESGACSKWGTSYLLSKGIKAKAVIVGEPGSETIAIGHRGGYQFKITVKGESVHTGISEWEKKKKAVMQSLICQKLSRHCLI